MKTIKEYLNEGLIKRQAGMDMRAKIEEWLTEYKIKNYTINNDLTIDVNGKVNLVGYKEKHLPDYIQFGVVKDYFAIDECPNLISLRGCPERVADLFDCSECLKLTSLEGSPKYVGGDFWCNGCPELESLEGCPKEIVANFICSKCPKLESLKGAPQKVGGSFSCGYCNELKSLEGCPKEVGAYFYCSNCGGQFTPDDIKKICDVKRKIHA